jgi:hypothetical protein
LEAEVPVLRLGSVTNKLGGSAPPFSDNADELRSGFGADIAAASEKLQMEIGNMTAWILGNYVRYCNSLVLEDFPAIFDDFKGQNFMLLWRGSRHGFEAKEFHRRCDGYPNTLTVIWDTGGNVFGGFTPVKWESSRKGNNKADPSLRVCFSG